MAPERAPTSPAQRCYITPEGRALNPSGRRQPVPDRTLGAQGQRPGGAINPHARKGVSTFGNTGKHRLSLSPDPGPDRAEGRLNPQARQGAALKDGKRYLRLPYLPVLPDPSAFFPLLS